MSSHTAWKIAGSFAAAAAGLTARKALERSWKAVQDRPPPQNLARGGVTWREALVWAATSAAIVSAARLLARSATGRLERHATGEVADP